VKRSRFTGLFVPRDSQFAIGLLERDVFRYRPFELASGSFDSHVAALDGDINAGRDGYGGLAYS
jgi:hypothetical protein